MIVNEQLRSQVVAAPHDDTPRLVYADWLEENGDADRAEFIRVQIQLAQLSASDPHHANQNSASLAKREAELLAEYGVAWMEEFDYDIEEWQFRRGFVERASIGMPEYVYFQRFQKIWNSAPITHLRDDTQIEELYGYAEMLPQLGRLTGLEFWRLCYFDDEHMDAILRAPELANLETLILVSISDGGRQPSEATLLEGLHSPLRRPLREFIARVGMEGPSSNFLRGMADSPYLRNLRRVSLRDAGDDDDIQFNPLSKDTIAHLGKSPNFQNLEVLDIRRLRMSLDAWEAFLDWPTLPKLKKLWAAEACDPDTPGDFGNGLHPQVQQGLESLVPSVDWTTEHVAPGYRNTSWSGFSWHHLEDQHLLSMARWLKQRDYDGLEAAFRADCQRFAPEFAKEISELPLERDAQAYRQIFEEAIEQVPNYVETRAIWITKSLGSLHQLAFIDWDFENFQPHMESYFPDTEYHRDLPMSEAGIELNGKIWDQRIKRPDPKSTKHYLLARVVAVLGRACRDLPCPVPIYFYSYNDRAVFRLYP